MEIWEYHHTLDEFMDGRMIDDVELFSTKENALKYAEMNGVSRKDFTETNDGCEITIEKEWSTEIYSISRVLLDVALEMKGDK